VHLRLIAESSRGKSGQGKGCKRRPLVYQELCVCVCVTQILKHQCLSISPMSLFDFLRIFACPSIQSLTRSWLAFSPLSKVWKV
jgi:hypothetical protein